MGFRNSAPLQDWLDKYRSPCRKCQQSLLMFFFFFFFFTFLKQLIPRPLTRREKSKLQKTRDNPTLSLAIYQSITLGALRSWILRRKSSQRTARSHFTSALPLFSHVIILHRHPTGVWELPSCTSQTMKPRTSPCLCLVILESPPNHPHSLASRP